METKTIKDIVLQDQKDKLADGYDTYLQDVVNHGCQGGSVSGLIYYDDTLKFFEEHKEEINELLTELIDGAGCRIDELFKNFDSDDPLCRETNNMNLLAWFAYEEAARKVLEDQGIEV